MKNLTSNTNTDSSERTTTFSNTMKSLRELIGYDYYTSRTAFDSNGSEIVFVNEGLIGRIRIYVDGEQVLSRFPMCSDWFSDTDFSFGEHRYRIVSKMTNWITCAQDVTLYADGVEVARKIDPRLAALNWRQNLHFCASVIALGLLVGLTISALF